MEDRCIVESVKKTYMDAHKPKTLKHVEAVAGTAVWLAGIHYLDQAKTETAAMLHDISVIMTPPEMYELAKERSMTIDPAEEKYPFLLHQRISKLIALERFGVTDPDILNAVECHTTLKKNAGPYDQAVFIADKISWDQEGQPPYYDTLKRLAAESLDKACFFYIRYQFDHHLLLMPHQWIIEAYQDLKTRVGTPDAACEHLQNKAKASGLSDLSFRFEETDL